ncbi:MAG TPA: hypothetical protein VIJ31_12200 [Acidothermaceae bacterium]
MTAACAECGVTDTEPKHIVVTRLAPTETVTRHQTCCATVGCWHDLDEPQHCANVIKAGA